jgi:hypothetical protein
MANAYVKRFASGKSRQHVHFKKELVTEISFFPIPRAVHSPMNCLSQDHVWEIDQHRKVEVRRRRRQVVASLFDRTGSWDAIGCTNKGSLVDPPSSGRDSSYFAFQDRAVAAEVGLARGQPDPPTALKA